MASRSRSACGRQTTSATVPRPLLPRLPELSLGHRQREALPPLGEAEVDLAEEDEPFDHVVERGLLREGLDDLDDLVLRLDGGHGSASSFPPDRTDDAPVLRRGAPQRPASTYRLVRYGALEEE